MPKNDDGITRGKRAEGDEIPDDLVLLKAGVTEDGQFMYLLNRQLLDVLKENAVLWADFRPKAAVVFREIEKEILGGVN